METRSWSSKSVGVLISVRTAESVELGQVVWTKPPERLPWEPEGPHLLICFKRHQKSTKEAEFLNFWMLVSYCLKYKVRQERSVGWIQAFSRSFASCTSTHLCHAKSASWSFLLWKVKNRSDKLPLVAQTEILLETKSNVQGFRGPVCFLVFSLCLLISSDEAPLRGPQPLRC